MMNAIKVMTVFGTRPEAVKMAPLALALAKRPEIDATVCVTAQHREMLDSVLDIFHIKPDYDLDIMQSRQTLAGITTRAIEGLEAVMREAKPDIVLVHGDTTTTFAGALAAFYNQIAVGHVEAGLRTYDKYAPFPEEMNRKLTGQIADLHFAPTKSNAENLMKENVDPNGVFITGNTVIDALAMTVDENYTLRGAMRDADYAGKRVIVVTAHRRENLGTPLREICGALKRIVTEFADVEIVYPLHLNPAVREVAREILGGMERVRLTEPADVRDLHNAVARCYMVMTDSGGLQEEAPSLGKPVLVLRNETERPEAVRAGTVKIAGVDGGTIYDMAARLLTDSGAYREMAHAVNPYGDGNASERIADAILYRFGKGARPADLTV